MKKKHITLIFLIGVFSLALVVISNIYGLGLLTHLSNGLLYAYLLFALFLMFRKQIDIERMVRRNEKITKREVKSILHEQEKFRKSGNKQYYEINANQKQILETVRNNDLLIEVLKEVTDHSELRKTREDLLSKLTADNKSLKESIVHKLDHHNDLAVRESARTRKELYNTYNRLDALMSIHNLIKLQSPLPIMKDWAISSDFGLAVLQALLSRNGGNVIDVGSGISTLLCGYVLKMKGKGKVHSLEHDKSYFAESMEMIKKHQLEDVVELNYCPLKNYEIAGQSWLWYDISKVKLPKRADVLIVDGPPAATQKFARYPVIPIIGELIDEKTIVLLDDAYRQEEKEIGERWNKEFGLGLNFIKSHKGYWVS